MLVHSIMCRHAYAEHMMSFFKKKVAIDLYIHRCKDNPVYFASETNVSMWN